MDESYINEIIRVNYKCNWQCRFCNVLKTNNYWDTDVSYKEVVYKVLLLTKKYTLQQRENLILSFSWGEPTLNKNLGIFIKLAKKIWIGTVEIQTNGTILFKDKKYIHYLIDAGLDEIFLAQHWSDSDINKQLWSYFLQEDFEKWVDYIKSNNLHQRLAININIVVTKINIFHIVTYLGYLKSIWFLSILSKEFKRHPKLSLWFCQPNGYAELNKNEVLLHFWDKQAEEIKKIIDLAKTMHLIPDFHFTSPPLCILDYKEYNLEYNQLSNLEKDVKNYTVNTWNLESYKILWKEKEKLSECEKCPNNTKCLWFYKNWISFVWEEYIRNKIYNYISNYE